MAIKVLAGDFGKGDASIMMGNLFLPDPTTLKFGARDMRAMNTLKTVEIASEESVKKMGGTIGWGAAGAVLLGPVGLLAGLLLGGKKTTVTFVAMFGDGKKFMGQTDPKTYAKLAAAAF